MTRTVIVQSFRKGTGKSTLIANLAVWLAREGVRVGVADADFATPSLSLLLDTADSPPSPFLTFNHFLWGDCDIREAARPWTGSAGEGYLLPASAHPKEIMRMVRARHYGRLLNTGLQEFSEQFQLDILLVDTHAGLSEDSLAALAIADLALMVMRPDQQDYQGTAIIVELAQRLAVPQVGIVVNEFPHRFDRAETEAEIAQTYGCEVLAILPHSEDTAVLASKRVLSVVDGEHALSQMYRALAQRLLHI